MPLVQLTVVVSALLGWSDIDIQPSNGERAAQVVPERGGAGPPHRADGRDAEAIQPRARVSPRRQQGAAPHRAVRPAAGRAGAGVCPGRALVDRGQAAGAMAQAAGHRPLPRCRRVCLRLPLRQRPGAGPGAQSGRPAVPAGHGALQRRARPRPPRGEDRGARSAPRTARSSRSSSTAASGRSGSSSRNPRGEPATSRSCCWPPTSMSAG